jgi:hypothetical protein
MKKKGVGLREEGWLLAARCGSVGVGGCGWRERE